MTQNGIWFCFFLNQCQLADNKTRLLSGWAAQKQIQLSARSKKSNTDPRAGLFRVVCSHLHILCLCVSLWADQKQIFLPNFRFQNKFRPAFTANTPASFVSTFQKIRPSIRFCAGDSRAEGLRCEKSLIKHLFFFLLKLICQGCDGIEAEEEKKKRVVFLVAWVNVGQLVDTFLWPPCWGHYRASRAVSWHNHHQQPWCCFFCYDTHTHTPTKKKKQPRSTLSIFIYLKSMSAPKFPFEVYWMHKPVSGIRAHAGFFFFFSLPLTHS